jgi:amidase
MKARAARLAPGDKTLAAERLRGAAASHREWVDWDRSRAVLRAQWRSFFEDFDALLCPIMPTPAYPHDATPDQDLRRIKVDGRDYPYVDQLVWPGVATCPGVPATAIPLGLSPGGLPVGAQLVGPWLEDRTPLKLAELVEQAFGGFVPPPGFD